MEYIKSPLNYIGGKYKLLPQLLKNFPNNIDTFVDLFGGGGSVLLNINAKNYVYNDIVPYIKDILQGISEVKCIENFINDVLLNTVKTWDLSKENKHGFEEFRDYYNSGNFEWYNLYLLMCFSFNNQFRFNSKHQYNSSFGKQKCLFGGTTINKLRDAKSKLDTLNIEFFSRNFTNFDFSKLSQQDFIYCDPPYLNSKGNYNDGKRGFNGWGIDSEIKLREILCDLNSVGIRWALSNNLSCNFSLEDWAVENGFEIRYLNFDYSNSNYHRKDKSADREVLITNY